MTSGDKDQEMPQPQSEDRFRLLFDGTADALFLHDLEGRFVEVNQAACDSLGYTREELLQLPLTTIVKCGKPEGRCETWARVIKGEKLTVQRFHRRQDGTEFPVEVHLSPFEYAGRSHILASARDITERLRNEEALRTSESFLNSIIDQSPYPMWISDAQGTLIRINQTCQGLLHITTAEVVGKYNVFKDNIVEQQGFYPLLRRVFEKGETVRFEITYDTSLLKSLPLGTAKTVILDVTVSPIIDARGQITNAVFQHVDITDRKRAEAALELSEKKYRNFYQSIPDGFVSVDLAGHILETNQSYLEMIGYTAEEVQGLRYQDLTPAKWHEFEADIVAQQVLTRGYSDTYEKEYIHKDGTIFPIELRAYLIKDKAGAAADMWAFVRDITERKQTEGALKKEKLFTEAILDSLPGTFFLLDSQGRHLRTNTSGQVLSGYSLEELSNMHALDFIAEEDKPAAQRTLAEVLEKGAASVEAHHLSKDGRKTPFLFTAKKFIIDHMPYILGTGLDITERKQAEEALRESEARFRQVVESSPLPIGLCTAAGMIEYVNPKFVETFGFTLEDVPQLADWFRLAYPDPAYRQSLLSRWQESLERFSIEGQPAEVMEVEITCKDGSKRIMQIFGALVGNNIITVFNDLTERKRMEAALEKRLVAFSRPLDDAADIDFHDLFNLEDIQRIQDLFAKSTGVASLITTLDGTPITAPSNFCRLCREIVRQTEQGLKHCIASDTISQYNPDGPIIRQCLSAGLCSAGASITVGGKHIANWFVGQVRDETQNEETLRDYARTLGVDAEDFIAAYREIPVMSADQFQQVAQALFVLANQLSAMAYQNVQQARFITERKRMESALRDSERRLAEIIDFLPDATFAIDLTGKVITWNRAIEEMTGVQAESMVGKGDYEYALAFYGVRRPILIDLVTLSDEELEKKYVFVQRQGDILLGSAHVPVRGENRLLWAKARPLYNNEGQVIGALETIRDITEHKQAEEALRESEARFRQVVESSPLPLAIAVEDGLIEYVNPKFVETFGYTLKDIPQLEDWYRRAYPDLHYREKAIKNWRKALGKAARKNRPTETIEVEVTCKDGSKKIINILGTLIGNKTLGVFHDVTARKRAEEERARMEDQMREVQKLESLGLLAGGIAHDFNNLLMAILGNADLALLALSPASPARPNVEEIARASQRAADLCRQMLAYSGKGRFVVGHYDLSEIVQEMAQMLEVSVSKKASLRYSFAADLPAVEVDATQMRQIIMNLITNASEALGSESGVISISTGVTDCDRTYLAESHLDDKLPEGRYVYLEVADTGSGMDEETRRRTFDPFFTTKFTGRGLGLAAVLGIVRGHRGAIKVRSEPGQGTTFTILLPAVAWKPGDRKQETARAAASRRQGTILLIDDDPHVRRVAGEMLERLGLQVLTAAHGQAGLELFRAKGGEIDCVLLDLTMPGMGGEEAFQELRRLRRDVPVVLSSGYDEQDITRQFAGQGLAGFIQKPYTVAKLQEVLTRVLG